MKFFQKENFGLDCGVECGLHSKNIVGVTRGLHSKNCIGLECGLHSKSSGVCNALVANLNPLIRGQVGANCDVTKPPLSIRGNEYSN